MADITVVVVRNDFEELALELRSEAEHQVAKTANAVEASMKATSSARIAKTVRTKRTNGGLTAKVVAGDEAKAIHAGFVEYGTTYSSAAPFATPAAEGERPEFMGAMKKLLDRGL